MAFNPVFDPTAQGPFDWTSDGQEKYENGRRYVMTGGQWVDYGPGAPPVMPVDNNVPPWGVEPETGGGTKVIGGVTYKKVNGDWVAQPSAGATGGLLGNIGDEQDRLGGTNMAWGNLANVEENYDPYTAYLQQLGIGTRTAWNPAERYRAAQYKPLKGLYNVYQNLYRPGALYDQPTQPQYGTFTDYAQSIGALAGGRQAQYGQAQQMLRDIFNAPEERRLAAGASYSPGPGVTEAGESVMNPYDIGELQDLLALGLRQKYGVQGARGFADTVGREQQAFYGQQAAGGAEAGSGSFVDYIRQKYGLTF